MTMMDTKLMIVFTQIYVISKFCILVLIRIDILTFWYAENSPYNNTIKMYMEYCTEHLNKDTYFTAFDGNNI